MVDSPKKTFAVHVYVLPITIIMMMMVITIMIIIIIVECFSFSRTHEHLHSAVLRDASTKTPKFLSRYHAYMYYNL